MRLFTTNDGIAKAVDEATLDLLDLTYKDIGSLLAADPLLESLTTAKVRKRVKISEVTLFAPVPRPPKVYCMAANYHSHLDNEVAEVLKMLNPDSGSEDILALKQTPSFFGVASSAVNGPNDQIQLPHIAPEQVDYEVELAVIIGLGGKDLDADTAWEHIAGLTIANDVSARDIQAKAMSSQLFELGHAKGLDTFKPMGPCMVTRDEFSMPLDLLIEARVNGELRQSERTTGMVHDVAHSIAEISRYFTLLPGDVILTGSPAGVGFFQGKYLCAGDIVELSAEGIGSIRNEVVEQ